METKQQGFKVGKYVTDYAAKLTKEYWSAAVDVINQCVKDGCKNNCRGCKALTNPNPCRIGFGRAMFLHGMMNGNLPLWDRNVLGDLIQDQFEGSPYVKILP